MPQTIGLYDQNWETCLVTRGRWVGECFGKRAALEGTGGWVGGPGRPGRNLGAKIVSKKWTKKGGQSCRVGLQICERGRCFPTRPHMICTRFFAHLLLPLAPAGGVKRVPNLSRNGKVGERPGAGKWRAARLKNNSWDHPY